MMVEPNAMEISTDGFEAVAATMIADPHLQGCIQCGICGGVCPYGSLMEYPPTRIFAALRADTFSQVFSSDTLWMCVACSSCTSVCPRQISLTTSLMSRLKEELILHGNIPGELQTALENSQRYGNPFGEASRKRADWVRGSMVPVPILGKDLKETQVLWFVGDYAAYHPGGQRASRAFARLLHHLGVDFAILGNEETSDGDSQRLAGERGLFELLAEKNGKTFQKYKFQQIVTTDPHAYNALKKEYPALGPSYPVQHATQFLADRLHQLKPLLKHELKARVTYHDPCYLGRVNGIFEEPRALLQAIPGITLVEMSHQRRDSLCCGGGGGGMWLDGFQWEKSHIRLPEWRVQEALMVKANVLAIACPLESPRFEDAVKTNPQASGLVVKDICELLADSIDLDPGNAGLVSVSSSDQNETGLDPVSSGDQQNETGWKVEVKR